MPLTSLFSHKTLSLKDTVTLVNQIYVTHTNIRLSTTITNSYYIFIGSAKSVHDFLNNC